MIGRTSIDPHRAEGMRAAICDKPFVDPGERGIAENLFCQACELFRCEIPSEARSRSTGTECEMREMSMIRHSALLSVSASAGSAKEQKPRRNRVVRCSPAPEL